MIRFFPLLALTLGLPATSFAGTPDGIVKAQLEAKGVKFEVDVDGDFKLVY